MSLFYSICKHGACFSEGMVKMKLNLKAFKLLGRYKQFIIPALIGAALMAGANLSEGLMAGTEKSGGTGGPITSGTDGSDLSGGSKTNSAYGKMSFETYTEYLTKQIESFVSTIEGVGKVKALVYVDSSFSIVAAADSEKNNTHTTEKDSQGGTRDTENATDKQTHVIIKNKDGSESVVVLQENCPALKGIAISAQGADSSVIQEKIKNALIALYGLPAHKIDVVGMK